MVRRVVAAALAVVVVAGGGYLLLRQADDLLDPAGSCEVRIGDDSVSLQPEQAQNAALIAGIGVRRELPVRAVAVALATVYQESKIVNVDYGDRDSLGLFQQRPSMGWGTEAQVQDPEYAAGKFLERLVQVPGWQTARLTDAAQTVQRSGFPEAYQKHEAMAIDLTAALRAAGGELDCG